MDDMIHQQAERESQRAQANREELVERIRRAMHEDGATQPLRGLYLSRSSSPLEREVNLFLVLLKTAQIVTMRRYRRTIVRPRRIHLNRRSSKRIATDSTELLCSTA